MNETVLNLLQAISDTRGFIMFCLVIAVAYASIWTLFLFEPAPKKKKKPKEGEDKDRGEYEEDERPQDKKAPPKKEKQAA